MRVAAVVADAARALFTQPLSLRSCLLIPCGAGLALLLVWPREPLAAVMRVGPTPNPFDVVAVSLALFGLYLSARHGAEDYTPDSAAHLRDYVRFAPMPMAEIVLGKAAFGIAHTLFLLLLGAPFLIVSMAGGGVTAGQALAAAAVTGAACLCARMLGLLVLVVVRAGPLARDMVLLPVLVLVLVLTLLFFPAASPIDAVLGRTWRQAGTCAAVSLLGALALGVVAAFSLRVMRRPDA